MTPLDKAHARSRGLHQIGWNVPRCNAVDPAMTDMDHTPLSSANECVSLLQRVLHCLDEVLPEHVPDEADRFALAATYVQQVIDLLD